MSARCMKSDKLAHGKLEDQTSYLPGHLQRLDRMVDLDTPGAALGKSSLRHRQPKLSV